MFKRLIEWLQNYEYVINRTYCFHNDKLNVTIATNKGIYNQQFPNSCSLEDVEHSFKMFLIQKEFSWTKVMESCNSIDRIWK